MKAPTNNLLFKVVLMFCVIFIVACAETKKEDLEIKKSEPPRIEAASQEYVEIIKKTNTITTNFEFDALGEYMADDVEWYWPDGGVQTRSILEGKDTVIAFWKNWQQTSGVEKIEFFNTNFLCARTNIPTNYYNVIGVLVLYYGDTTITTKNGSITVRQHLVYSFNDDKKIQKVFLYYDRSGFDDLLDVNLKGAE